LGFTAAIESEILNVNVEVVLSNKNSFGDTPNLRYIYKFQEQSDTMTTETVCIPTEEYIMLKKKEAIADDLVLQLDASLRDLETGRVKRAPLI